jgi:hypothetical protein
MQKISVKPVDVCRDIEPSTLEGLVEALYQQAIEVAWLWNTVADQVANGGCLPKGFANKLEVATKTLELVQPGSYFHQRYTVARGAKSDQFLSDHTSERVSHAVFWQAAGMLKLIVDYGTADPERWHHFQLCDDERWLFDELANERMAMLDLIATGKPCLLPPRDETPRAVFVNTGKSPPGAAVVLTARAESMTPDLANLLTEASTEAPKFKYDGNWCTAEYASKRFRIKAPQLTKSAREEGLYGVVVERRRVQISDGNSAKVLYVYHAGSLQLLSDVIHSKE